MTAAPQDADLGLNLVFESAPTPAPKTTRAPAKKRKNKYDRRREKGRLAKLAKNGDVDAKPSKDAVTKSGPTEISGISSAGSKTPRASTVNDNVAVSLAPPKVQAEEQANVPQKSEGHTLNVETEQINTDTNSNAAKKKPSISKTAVTSTVNGQATSSRMNRVSTFAVTDECTSTQYHIHIDYPATPLYLPYDIIGTIHSIRRGGTSSIPIRISCPST